jgi:predicted kinase
MEAILFCGIQAAGKTSFYGQNFVNTHMRISLDLLNTRNKEKLFIKTCLDINQRFVVDNTNPTKKERQKYIQLAKSAKFRIVGYYFKTEVQKAIERNLKRKGKEKIPEVGIRGTHNRLEIPEIGEGFDELYLVEILEDKFVVSEWDLNPD